MQLEYYYFNDVRYVALWERFAFTESLQQQHESLFALWVGKRTEFCECVLSQRE